MSQQPKSWQTKYLSSLKDYGGLYWYCEATLPPSMRKNKLAEGWTPVGYPGKHIPVIPLGNDWQAARRLCDFLCWVLRVHVPYALEVAPVVASADDLDRYGAPWYDWRADVLLDCACACCGAVERVSHVLAGAELRDGQPWPFLCEDCVSTARWRGMYVEVASGEARPNRD